MKMGDKQSPPKVYADAESRQTAYHKATDHLLFTKDFNTALEAWMDDPLETPAPRLLAWAKRTSWGRWSLYCVNDDGSPAYQVKAAEELHLDKRVISKTANYLFKRGVLGMDGKVLYPVISPVPADNSFRSDQKSVAYATFLEEWKVAHASDFQEFEDARSKVETYRKVLLRGFGQWKKQATNGGPSLLLEEEEFKEEPPPTNQPISPAPEPEEEEPAGWPVVVPEDNPQTPSPADEVRSEVKAYLESIPRPGLTPQIVEEVAKHITTKEALEAFKVETLPAKVQGAQTWKYFVAIAQRVGVDAPRYAVAKANGGNGHSPPQRMSNGDIQKADFVRRFKEQEQKKRAGQQGNSS